MLSDGVVRCFSNQKVVTTIRKQPANMNRVRDKGLKNLATLSLSNQNAVQSTQDRHSTISVDKDNRLLSKCPVPTGMFLTLN